MSRMIVLAKNDIAIFPIYIILETYILGIVIKQTYQNKVYREFMSYT